MTATHADRAMRAFLTIKPGAGCDAQLAAMGSGSRAPVMHWLLRALLWSRGEQRLEGSAATAVHNGDGGQRLAQAKLLPIHGSLISHRSRSQLGVGRCSLVQ